MWYPPTAEMRSSASRTFDVAVTSPSACTDILVERDRRYLARPTRRIPLAVKEGQGAILVDLDGREMVDLTSGWNVVNTGWNHPKIVAAVRDQLSLTAFAPPWCTHNGRVDYAQRLSEWLGRGVGGEWMAWSGAGGSEAVEAALKIARKATGRQTIVGFEHAYHGGTLGSMLAGGVSSENIWPDVGVHRHAPVPDNVRADGREYGELARQAILAAPRPAAVLLEPLFTNPGVLFGVRSFYESVTEAVSAVGAVLIVDEIGTGFGRTGTRFAVEQTALRPDIVVTGKAMTSGAVPMSAALVRPELAKAVAGPGFSATFGWTPLACAAAIATLDIIDAEDLVTRSRVLGEHALALLRPLEANCEHVAEVRGRGLEIGVELVSPDGSPVAWTVMGELTRRLLQRGVFAEPSAYTSTLLVMPPLVITERQLESALSIVAEEVSLIQVH